MRFYRDKYNNHYYYNEIEFLKLTCIYCTCFVGYCVIFFKNGLYHNSKNAAYIYGDNYKQFRLNDINHSYDKDFNKKSWRRFVKLQTFL